MFIIPRPRYRDPDGMDRKPVPGVHHTPLNMLADVRRTGNPLFLIIPLFIRIPSDMGEANMSEANMSETLVFTSIENNNRMPPYRHMTK